MLSPPPGGCRCPSLSLRLALSINPHHSSYRLLKEGQAFSVNVLKKGQLELAAHYGGPAGPFNWLWG